MKKFICTLISDVDGQASSKRFITMLSFFCLMLAFLVNVFNQVHLEPFVFNGMMYLCASGLGFSTLEKFSRDKATPVSDESLDSQPEVE
jgi:hypothetical protein